MKRKPIIFCVILLVITGIIGGCIYYIFFDIERIHGQEVLTQSIFPKGTYTITAYLNNGGATVDYAVLCDVVNNKTNKRRNIYWNYHCNEASIEWVDDVTVIINDVKLDIRKDTYDFRKQ